MVRKKLADGKSWQNPRDELQNIELYQSSAKALLKALPKALPKALLKALQHSAYAVYWPHIALGGPRGSSP